MLKIAVFGFYSADTTRPNAPDSGEHVSPVSTEDFMRSVWQMEPPAIGARIGAPDAPCFVKLSAIASQPVYVQSLSNRMAPGVGLLNCDGYVAIIDAVKILAPRTIQSTLRRLYDLHPHAHLIIAAGRQNEPEALSSDEIRDILGLHPDLPVYPYVPTEPTTVSRVIKRLVRAVDDPVRVPPPIFAGKRPLARPAIPVPAPAASELAPVAPPAPHIHGLAHTAITVSHLSRSLDFYRGLLGFRVLGTIDVPGDPHGLTITHLDTGSGLLALYSYAEGTVTPPPEDDPLRAGLRALVLRVTGLDAIAEQLFCADVPFVRDPAPAAGGLRAAVLTDPDGALIELIEGDIVYSRR